MKEINRYNNAPFLKILPIVILGIIFCNHIPIPLLISIPTTILCIIMSFMLARKPYGTIFSLFVIFFCVAIATNMRTTKEIMPKGEKITFLLTIEDNPYQQGRWQQCSAHAELYEYNGVWHKTNEKLITRIDTCVNVSAGDKLIASAYLNPISNDTISGYARLMYRRGYTATCYITSNNDIVPFPEKGNNLKTLAAKIQKQAIQRFETLELNNATNATCLAMVFGDKRSMDSILKNAYSLSGTAHILAVSGLHVGIVALLINIILSLFVLGRYGHIIKNIIAIIMILLYAMMTGLSPSVIRASIMFCGLQIAYAASLPNNRLNIILAAATIMLLINPNYLYDISFQLSFVAVLGIFTLFTPIYNFFRCKYMVLNYLTGIVIVGVVATIATAPIISAQFGHISLMGILINPIIILTANIIIFTSLIYTIIPVTIIAPIAKAILDFTTSIQNDIIFICSTMEWSAINVQISPGAAVAIYIIAIVCTISAEHFIKRYTNKNILPKP